MIDVGCGEGSHSLRLAERFGFGVCGVDPVQRHIDIADHALRATARAPLQQQVSFTLGTADQLPADDASIDLVWCRDVLVHVTDLDRAYTEFRRVLHPGGRALVYQMFATDRLEPAKPDGCSPPRASCRPAPTPSAPNRPSPPPGCASTTALDLGTEWGEYAEENHATAGRKLLHAARLLRDPHRYTSQYGKSAYDIMLADCLWHVYRMIGKLSPRTYLLSRPATP